MKKKKKMKKIPFEVVWEAEKEKKMFYSKLIKKNDLILPIFSFSNTTILVFWFNFASWQAVDNPPIPPPTTTTSAQMRLILGSQNWNPADWPIMPEATFVWYPSLVLLFPHTLKFSFSFLVVIQVHTFGMEISEARGGSRWRTLWTLFVQGSPTQTLKTVWD